jgi:hypothetical protein
MSKWPGTVTEDMWACALHHVVNFYNASIRKDKVITPYAAFTGQSPPWRISDLRVFRSPTYVLRKELQDGTLYSKWRPRAWLEAFMCPRAWLEAFMLVFLPATLVPFPSSITLRALTQVHRFMPCMMNIFNTMSQSPLVDIDQYLEQLFHTTAR